MKNKRTKHKTTRNWIAVSAHQRHGGAHKDRKKEAARKACRGRAKKEW